MKIRELKCPQCKAIFLASSQTTRTRIRCPNCGEHSIMPSPAEWRAIEVAKDQKRRDVRPVMVFGVGERESWSQEA